MKKLQNYIQTTFNGYIPGQIFFCRSKWAKTTRLVYLLGSVIILIFIVILERLANLSRIIAVLEHYKKRL